MTRLRIPGLAVMVLTLVLGLGWGNVSAAPGRYSGVSVKTYNSVPRYHLTVGKSIRIQSNESITRVSVGAKEVADFVLLSPHEIYVTGLATGVTNLMLWGAGNRVLRVYDLDVAPDLTRLKDMIHALLPDEAGHIKVMANRDSIALSGMVRDSETIQKVLALAESYAPKKVLNLLTVGGVQQVMLEVRVAEMAKSIVNRMGINLNAISSDGNFLYTLLGGLTAVTTIPSDSTTLSQATAVGRWNFKSGGTTTSVTGVIDALKENNLVRILAEPNLVCLNGQSADFLAGGMIPVPVPQSFGNVTIEWKEYGVALHFTPTIIGKDRINLRVHPEVSNLDYTKTITLNNTTMPSITTRRTSTTVELRDGQSFAVAGMLSENSRNAVDKYPWLGDIPILGNLFKSAEYQKDKTELVILITVHLVKPLDKKAITLPTDYGYQPDDMEFFLNYYHNNNDQAEANTPTVHTGAPSLDGDFGHAVPTSVSVRQQSINQ